MSETRTYSGACHPHVISVFSGGKRHYVSFSDLVYLEGYKGETTFFRKKGADLVAKHNLGFFEPQMPCCLVRVNRSQVINLHYLASETIDGRLYLQTDKAHSIWLTKKYKPRFYAALNQWNNRHVPPPPTNTTQLPPDGELPATP